MKDNVFHDEPDDGHGENYATEFMQGMFSLIHQYQEKMTCHEILGIMVSVQAKVQFDMNVKVASEELLRAKQKKNGIICP